MSDRNRYESQERVSFLGPAGQERLATACAVVVGVGGLGSNAAQLLVRAGVGRVRVADRDAVELSNLHRQVLYGEEDARNRAAKATVAAARLREINASVAVEAEVLDVGPHTVEGLLAGADVVVDGTDNAETRYLLNDACVKLSIPWVYGGAVEATAVAMAVGPGRGPCLRCAFPDPPDPGSLPTARTAGVLNTAVAAASTWQTAEVLRFLVTGQAHWGRLTRLDTWTGETVAIEVERDPDCPCCGQGRYEFLHS